MLQLRPTFSESWYRVVNLRARLRPTAQISRQYYRGERWYVMRDPAGNQFHRLNDAAYRFVGLLDGTRTVGEAWDIVGGQLADDAPTQPEVIQLLSQLHSANLLESDIAPDAMVLLRRHKMQQKRKFQGRLMSVLFPRIPLWDCDAFLKRWMPVVRPFLSWWGAILWVVAVVAAAAVIVPRWTDFSNDFANAIDPSNWMLLWITFVLLKFIHELGHAFACRRFGGEVHEMGIMFLVFIPTPYVDASTAWSFPSRWARMFVGAAGMVIEIFVAAIMVFVWANTNPSSTVHQVAFNAVWWASITTVLFNANPLLRYDGYYMLSDWLEIPNLQNKSKEYLLGLIKRHVFRVKAQQPLPPVAQRFILAGYGVLSTIYRIWIGIVIILLVAYQLPEQVRFLGYLMAVGGVVTWLVVPIVTSTKYLLLSPELHRKRGPAIIYSLIFVGLLITSIGLIRWPIRVYSTGVVEPAQREVIHAGVPGFVTDVKVHDGDRVEKDQVLFTMRDRELETQLQIVREKMKGARVREARAISSDPSGIDIVRLEIDALQREIDDLNRQRDELTVRAPIAGRLIAPNIQWLDGQYLTRGAEVATVATLDRLLVKAALSQRDAELVPDDYSAETEIRLAGDVGTVLYGEGTKRLPGAQERIDPVLTHRGGGEHAPDPQNPEGNKAAVPQFELRVNLANPETRYYPGQRAYVRMTVDHKPLLWQWTRRVLQLLQNEGGRTM